jgi:hypothetical protein
MNRWVAALAGITLLGIVLLGMMLFGESEPPLPGASATPSASALETDGPSTSAAPTQAAPPATTGAMLGGGGPPQDEHFGTVLGP